MNEADINTDQQLQSVKNNKNEQIPTARHANNRQTIPQRDRVMYHNYAATDCANFNQLTRGPSDNCVSIINDLIISC